MMAAVGAKVPTEAHNDDFGMEFKTAILECEKRRIPLIFGGSEVRILRVNISFKLSHL